MPEIIVHKHRTNTLKVDLGYDVSQDDITSDIREGTRQSSKLIARWNVQYETDGSDGRLLLTLDDSITSVIPHNMGYMDLKRVSGGEPLPVFDSSIVVRFQNTVTE